VCHCGLFTVPLVKPSLRSSGRSRESGTGTPGWSDELHLSTTPMSGAVYTPVSQRLLPLDEAGEKAGRISLADGKPAEVMGGGTATLGGSSRISFRLAFRACAESLASENASRLAAMQRADKKHKRVAGGPQQDIPSFAPEWASTRNCSTSFRLRSAERRGEMMHVGIAADHGGLS